ncbi:Mep-1 [Aphelenchoides fujianensis]|nr:Mep-1 [Aphelenchoides fujianensis]
MVNSEVQRNGVARAQPPVEIVIDDESDEEMPDITLEGPSASNGAPKPPASNGSSVDVAEAVGHKRSYPTTPMNGDQSPFVPLNAEPKKPAESVESDDDCVVVEEPPLKRPKPAMSEEPQSRKESPAPSLTKKEERGADYERLLNRLHEHVQTALKQNDNVDRKLLDTLLGAINVQVQRDPHAVRRLIVEKELVLPNAISFPPSQVVDLLIEHDADTQLTKVINRLFGDDRPKLADAERKERQQLKSNCPAPNMTRMLMEIGQDLVQEATYCDIVHARNLPEVPKNVETYRQVAAQLKPVWQNLRDKNASLKLKQHACGACGFKSDNLVQMSIHKQTLHLDTKNAKIRCGMCPEFNTNGTRIHKHYLEEHQLVPLTPDEPPSKIQCPICDEDFQYKGHRDAHLKQCKRDTQKVAQLQASRMPEHSAIINRWLWPRPPPDPTIQQDLQKAQQSKQRAEQERLLREQQLKERERQQQLAAARAAAQPPAGSQITPTAIAALLKSHQQQQANSPNAAVPANNPALLAVQQLQQQLRSLNPQQRQQMELLIRNAQNTSLPPAVLQAIQSQLQKLATPPPSAASIGPQRFELLGGQLTPQQLQHLQQLIQAQAQKQQGSSGRRPNANAQTVAAALAAVHQANLPQRKNGGTLIITCEICDERFPNKLAYVLHLKSAHDLFANKSINDFEAGAPLACSRCRERFWSYEGLERHLVMEHDLVTSDLLAKAQQKKDSGRCKRCRTTFEFNILQHLAVEHKAKLCSAEIMFSCDVCTFKCNAYSKLEAHLSEAHPKNGGRR